MEPSSPRKIEREVVSKIPNERRVFRAANDAAVRAYITKTQTETTRPRDEAIRQAANENVAVRKVKTTPLPSAYPTVDEEFSDSYEERGLQPSVGELMSYANDSEDVATMVPTRRSRVTYKQKGGSKNATALRNTSVERRLATSNTVKKASRAHSVSGAASAVLPGQTGSYVTAVEEASGLIPLTWGIWLTFQLPMAILCTAALAIAGVFTEAENAIRSNALGDFVWRIGAYQISVVNKALKSFLGLDLSIFHPVDFLIVCVSITAFIIWMQLLLVGVTYAIAGIPCLNGKGSVLKFSTFIAGMVGVLPILNFVPWATLWVIVVAANPTEQD